MGKKYWSDVIEEWGTRIPEQEYQDLVCSNKIPYSQFIKAKKINGRVDRNAGYTCGLNALNMAKKMLGYTFQWDLNNYPYTWMYTPLSWPLFLNPIFWFVDKQELKQKWGLHSGEFGKKLITPNFNTYNWEASDYMPWSVIDGTNFREQVVIVLVQYGLTLHYILLIGANDDKSWYITTDQSQKLHWISSSNLKTLMKVSIPKVCNYCAYRVG